MGYKTKVRWLPVKHLRFVLVCSVLLNAGAAFATYKGQVFIDKNGNNHADKGEKGVRNIAVSDGLNVVLTDSNGFYELPGTAKTRHIFITVPAGFKSSSAHYIKVDKETLSYNFGIQTFAVSKSKHTRFIQITDTESYEDGGWIEPIRDYANGHDVSFIVHTGDICYEKGLNFHAKALTSSTMGVPTYYCIGNHDLVKGEYGEALFEKLFGPTYYSFEAGDTHFVVTPMLNGDYKPSYTKEDVYRWLVNDLKLVDRSKKLVIFNHDLLTYGDDFIYGVDDKQQINLNEHNLKAWIYGHWHINYMKRHGAGGVVSVCSSTPDKGGIDHSSSNFLVYDISEKGKLSIEPRYNYIKKHLVFNMVSDLQNEDVIKLTVNSYNTVAPIKKVAFRVESDKRYSRWYGVKVETDWSWSTAVKIKEVGSFGINSRIRVSAWLDNGDTITRVKALHNSISANVKLVWMNNMGGNSWMCSPVYANGKVFAATMDEFAHRHCYISSFDAASGKLLWRYTTGSSVKNTICVEQGRVLATDEDGVAYALDADSGRLIWRKELGKNYLPAFVSGTTARNGVCYTGFGSYLSALSVADGSTIWKDGGWSGGEGTTSTHILTGDVLVASSNWNALFGHAATTGKMLWKVSEQGVRFRSGTSVVADDTLYVAADKNIVKMNPTTGTIYSVHPTNYGLQVATTPLVTAGTIVLGTADGGVVSFNRGDVSEKWRANVGTSLIYTSPYAKPVAATVEGAPKPIGNNICFGASDGFLYIVDSTNGKVLERVELGSPVLGSVNVEGRSIYVTDFGGNIYRFDYNKE